MLSQLHEETMLESWQNVLATVQQHLFDLLYVEECLSCSTEFTNAQDRHVPVCDACLSEIPPVDWPVCIRCAAQVPKVPGSVTSCIRCETNNLRFDQSFSLGHYDGLLRELVLRMKQDRTEQWGRVFGRLLVARHGSQLGQLNLDAIVPVPGTVLQRFIRGTSAPLVIARELARGIGVPVRYGLLRRNHGLEAQRGLSRAGRFRNVRGGYRVRRARTSPSRVLLVDDVMTTGATCSEVARLLKRTGTGYVAVAVVARTPDN